LERIGNDSITTRLTSNTQNRGGWSRMIAGPFVTAKRTTRHSPTAETAST
jgi:hypothetical protein